MALAQSMVLPDPAGWYHQTFGDYSGGKEIASYTNQRAQFPLAILGFFKNAIQAGNTTVRAKRFDTNCDDNDGENLVPTLDARVNSTPLFDLRLYKNDKFFKMWPLAYVDGTFRFVAEPHPWDYFVPRARTAATAAQGTHDQNPGDEKPPTHVNPSAIKLIERVRPEYPSVARNERLQGSVRLHAVIGKDGTITSLRVMKGYCSLARASVEAVKKWRYTPTMFQGEPVEVDTTIDVIFTLGSQ